MRRQKAKDPELVILWGSKTHTLDVGITRAVGWEVIGSASKDGMYARWDCPEEWAQRLVSVFTTLRELPDTDFSDTATHELVPPGYRELRPIEPAAQDEPGLFEVTP